MKKKMIFRDFSDFSIAGNNWKKKIIIIKNEKKNVQNLKGATAHSSRRLGAGARRRGRWGARLGAGREGVWQELGVRGRAGRRCRQLGARARGALARGRQGARAAGAQGGGRAGHARQGARQGRCWARRARRAQALCARPCTAWAWPGALAGLVGGSCSLFGF